MAERLERGFVTDYPDKMPPKSSAGFEWPGRRSATPEQRQTFRKNITNLLRTKAPNHREFARLFYGQTRDHAGYVVPRTPGSVRDWIDGAKFPTEDKARQLAAFFKVPMEQLVTDDGTPFEPMPLIRPLRATKARLKKTNGHGGNGAAGPPVVSPAAPAAATAAPLRLPKGAKPVTVEIKTLPESTDWCHVAIAGTVPLDVALGLMAFIDRHKGGPRK